MGPSPHSSTTILWRIVMMRSRIKVWSSNIFQRPAARENRAIKDRVSPYREPKKVPLAEKAKAFRNKLS